MIRASFPGRGGLAAACALIAFDAACGSGEPPRLPPGQTAIEGFPVYSALGGVDMDTAEWSLHIRGLVDHDTTLSWEEFLSLGPVTDTLDFHCVTGWSRLGDEWTGIPAEAVIELAGPDSSVVSVMVHCADGYTTNVPIEYFSSDGVMLAFLFEGEPLAPEHGFPVRLVVPGLYAYKSAKWVIGLEFLGEDRPGFWEQRGYDDRGDPWLEERLD